MRYLDNGGSLRLDGESCIFCGMCIDVCPHGVFEEHEKTMEIAYGERCMECGACAMNCPVDAVTVRSGVGCAYAVLKGLLRGTEPTCDCDCGPRAEVKQGCGCEGGGSKCS